MEPNIVHIILISHQNALICQRISTTCWSEVQTSVWINCSEYISDVCHSCYNIICYASHKIIITEQWIKVL